MPEEYLNIFKKYGFVSNSENNWDIIKQINQPGQTIVINGQQMQQPGKTFSINYHIEFLGEGLIDNNIKDVNEIPNEQIELLPYTPSAIAGSIRYKLKNHTEDNTDYLKILETLKKNNIKYIFLNGGNDSMDTSLKLLSFFKNY